MHFHAPGLELREHKHGFFWFMFSQAVESAGRKFVGEHDFRNFCKMDALNVHNYRRKITSFAVSPCDVRLTWVANFSDPFLPFIFSFLHLVDLHYPNCLTLTHN